MFVHIKMRTLFSKKRPRGLHMLHREWSDSPQWRRSITLPRTGTQVNEAQRAALGVQVGLTIMIVISGVISAVVYPMVLRKSETTIFSPSSPRLGFQPSVPSPRTTISIAFSCISTMVICIITAVHFNIFPRNGRPRGFWSMLFNVDNWWIAFVKIFTWTGGMLAPEGVTLWALNQFTQSSSDVQFMQEKGYPQWTMRHAFFANMGGLRLEDGTFVYSGRRLVELGDFERGFPMDQLDFETLEDDIIDKSKADILTKLIAVCQIIRFFVGTLVRKLQKLSVSPIEYITCAYVLCALVIYLVWFHKAYDVQESIRLAPNYVLPPEAAHAKQARTGSKSSFFRWMTGRGACSTCWHERRIWLTISVFSRGDCLGPVAVDPRRGASRIVESAVPALQRANHVESVEHYCYHLPGCVCHRRYQMQLTRT